MEGWKVSLVLTTYNLCANEFMLRCISCLGGKVCVRVCVWVYVWVMN